MKELKGRALQAVKDKNADLKVQVELVATIHEQLDHKQAQMEMYRERQMSCSQGSAHWNGNMTNGSLAPDPVLALEISDSWKCLLRFHLGKNALCVFKMLHESERKVCIRNTKENV